MKATVLMRRILVVLVAVLWLAGCATSPSTGVTSPDGNNVPLTNTYWELVTVGGEPVAGNPSGEQPHMIFLDDGRVSGFSGCNRFMGDYQVNGKNLVFDAMASTRMACPDNLSEQTLFAAFATTAGVNLEGDRLRLLDEAARELAVFKALTAK